MARKFDSVNRCCSGNSCVIEKIFVLLQKILNFMYKYTIKKDPEKGIYLLNEQEEEVAATDILEKCGDRRVFAFDGKMGAGKTTFIKCLCEAMGTEDVVNSPTFAIVNVYEVEAKGERQIGRAHV